MKYKTKNVLKKVLAISLACVIGIGAIAGISALANKSDDDGKVKVNPSYSIGGLDENGKYVESDATLYTKDAFECQGLTIKPDFDSNVQYQIFFYDEVGQFIESTGVLSTVYDDEVPFGSSRARLEITPVWGEDVKEKDQVIKWYNKHQWTNSLEIKVNEEQVFEMLTDNIYTHLGSGYFGENGFDSSNASYSCGNVDVSNYKSVYVKFAVSSLDNDTLKPAWSSMALEDGKTIFTNKIFLEENIVLNDGVNVIYRIDTANAYMLNISINIGSTQPIVYGVI